MRIVKFTFFAALFMFAANLSMGQIYNSVNLTIENGCFLHVDGALNNASGDINNSGTIILTGDYTNNGTFTSGNSSYVKLEGAAQNVSGSNATTYNNLVVDGSGDKSLFVDARIKGTLDLANNKIIAGNNNLVLLPTALITNASNTKFIVTNGTGALVKNSMPSSSNFFFPVGSAANSYKPVQLNNTGAVDTFAVRVTPGLVPPTSADNSCVQYTWVITETNPGGTNATLKVGWNTIDEGISYIRAQGLFWHNVGGVWLTAPGTPGAVSNAPTTDWRQQTTITDFSSNANKFILSSGTLVDVEENELAANNSISVYPNPTGSTTTIAATFTLQQVMIMDYSGKVVGNYNNVGSSKFVFSADDLADGMYIISATGSKGERKVCKLMISR